MQADRITKFHSERIRFELLDIARDKEPHLVKSLEQTLADRLGLSKNARREKKTGGKITKLLDRICWCRTDLKMAKLVSDPEEKDSRRTKKGYYRITKDGLRFLDTWTKDTVTEKDLLKIGPFAEWRRETKDRKKKQRRSNPSQGTVIMIDALGTKAEYRANNPNRIEWKRFVGKLEHKINESMGNRVRTYMVSDTIIIAITSPDIDETLVRISPILKWAIIQSVDIDRPIRGCISTGEIHTDNIQVTGMPVVEAAGYYEQAQWIGISACPSVHAIIESMQEDIRRKSFYKFDLPLRNSIEFDAWAVDWTHGVKPGDSILASLDRGSKTPDLHIALKWRNTRRFFLLAKSR